MLPAVLPALAAQCGYIQHCWNMNLEPGQLRTDWHLYVLTTALESFRGILISMSCLVGKTVLFACFKADQQKLAFQEIHNEAIHVSGKV